MTRLPLALAVTAALALAPLPALAGGTQKRVVSTHGDLDKGETEGAAIEASGKVTVGFLPQRGEIKATTAFSCLGQDKSVLVGSADEAAIWRVFPNFSSRPGKATRAKTDKDKKGKKAAAPEATLKVEKLAKLEGVVVSAMATLPGGDVLAAVVPGGKIFRVTPRGKVTTFAELKVSQIWALEVHKGRVLAGTGPKGELWSLSTAGKDPKIVLDVEEKDVLSVLAIGDAIVAGVGPSAKIYQVIGDVEGRMLHAFSGGDEVRAMAVTKDGLVAAVNAFTDRQLSSLDAMTKTLNRTSLTGQEASGGLANDRPPSAAARLFHVDLGPKRDVARALEAPWDQWLDRDKQYFTSLLADGDTVLVASSESGKIYRAKGPRDVATVGDFEERQATALCSLPKGPVFATVAHGAGVYQLRAAAASGAKYRSQVFDAGQPASYGAIVLRGAGLTLRARVGPTETHDRQWSEWKTIPLRKGIAGLRGSLVGLPQRRHLELEVSLTAPGSELRSIELFYAPENLAPLLTAVDVDHPSFEGGSDKEPGTNVTIKWKVDERDGDDLVYDVRIRPEGSSEGEWIKITDDDELVTAKEFKLDLTTVPDGVYEVEVTASDEPTNGSANAKSDELRSAPFVVDRQRPEVTGVSVKGRKLTAKAVDAGGYVHDVAYSVDGGPFRSASPSDGLFDSPAEDLAIELPELRKGKHRIVIRARDSFGNIGTSAIVITI